MLRHLSREPLGINGLRFFTGYNALLVAFQSECQISVNKYRNLLNGLLSRTTGSAGIRKKHSLTLFLCRYHTISLINFLQFTAVHSILV